MSNWIECPTCATDFDLDSVGWDDGTIDDTIKAFDKTESANDQLEQVKGLLEDVLDYLNYTGHPDHIPSTIEELQFRITKVLKETE